MLLAVAAACAGETVEVPGETVVVEKVVTETVEVPGETVVVEKEVIKTVEVPGETVTKEVVKEVMVPGETVVVEKVITETVEVPGETVTVEVVKEVQVPGETVVVEKEVVKTVEVPGQTVVVEKVVTETVEVPGETVVVEKVVTQTVEVPGQTVIVEKEVVKTVEVPGETVVVTKEVAGPERVVVKEVRQGYVFDPATGMTWTAPQYGGTLTFPAAVYPENADMWWVPGWATHFTSSVTERLAFADWGLSRDIWDGRVYTVVSPEMTRGALAESWSMPDDTTFIWNIRQGVYWDNKAPVNGRELTAKDIEWNYHRYFGMGDFTEDGPNAAGWGLIGGVQLESVTATDKWTVEIKLKPHVLVMKNMLNNHLVFYAPEQIEKYGDAKDWRNLVGTGPLRLTEYVEGSSVTWEKNPNYWGFDEKFPKNRLPYIDEYRSLLMKDMSTRLAAMRTGKIDMMSNAGDSVIKSIDDVEALQRTNPEIDVWPANSGVYGGGTAYHFNQSLPLMQDVNVRKALQMAVDRETISATLLKGYGDPAPGGTIKQSHVGWSWPYEDWPDEVKQEFTYNPERAEELLDAAGHPRGADGIRFKVKMISGVWAGSAYPEIVAAYFAAIGVDSELSIVEGPEYSVARLADTHEWELYLGGYGSPGGSLRGSIAHFVPAKLGNNSYTKGGYPRMDALYLAALETTDLEEYKSLFRQADEISVREHVAIVRSSSPDFAVSQPWVQGYFGEAGMGTSERYTFMARLWIDSEMKEAMGH